MPQVTVDTADKGKRTYKSFSGGMFELGHDGPEFAFDCEAPRHSVHVQPFRLADRPVTNGEWIEFIADGGYRNPLAWLSDGWVWARGGGWNAPLYWEERDGEFWTMTLRGFQPVNVQAPVCHVSYFEADAFATWAQKRLPTEAEWELAAQPLPLTGNFADSGRLRPKEAPAATGDLRQMFGDVWEDNAALSLPYPRFRSGGRARWVSSQWEVHVGSIRTARRLLRYAARAHAGDLPKLLSAAGAVAIFRIEIGGGRVVLATADYRLSQPELFRQDVLAGLSMRRKTLPCRWLYDERGSELFEQITRLEEYYPTRTETGILRQNAGEIAGFIRKGAVLIEYGAGAGIKTEILIQRT